MPNHYNYLTSMIDDVLECIRNELDYKELAGFSNRETLFDALYEALQGNVTNHSTCTEDAENCVCHNWPLLRTAADEFEVGLGYTLRRGPIYADSLIRRYLLPDAIKYAIGILEANGEITYTATSA